MPQLDPTWFASQLFWLAICFSVLYVVLARVILPPLQSVLATRKNAVDSDIEAAQALKSDAEHAQQVYEHTQAQSREMAQALMNEAELASKARGEAENKALDAKVAAQLADASKQIAAKKEKLLADLTPAAVELSALIVEKMTLQAPSKEQVERAQNTIISNVSK